MGLASGEVVLHASGRCEDGYGGWAAVLTHGSHQRELSGSGNGTGVTSHRMALTAVVEGLTALTRPSRVRICVADETLHEKRAQRQPPDEPDLWQRLRPLLARHHVVWTEPGEWAHVGDEDSEYDEDSAYDEDDDQDEWADETPCDLAAELAFHRYRGEEVRAEAQGEENTLTVAVSRFLAERWDDMHAFEAADDVISTLHFSIGWYGDTPFSEMAPAEVVDELGPFFSSTLPHKQHASPHELRTAKRVVTDLLNWLVANGHVDAEAARDRLEDIDITVDERASLKEFVDAFADDDLVPWPDRSSIEDRVDCQYLTIAEVADRSLTFKDYDRYDEDDGPAVGPVPVRPEIAARARTGWRILLSAAKVRGQWRLVEVVSGDP
jgi:ribonuclease HI